MDSGGRAGDGLEGGEDVPPSEPPDSGGRPGDGLEGGEDVPPSEPPEPTETTNTAVTLAPSHSGRPVRLKKLSRRLLGYELGEEATVTKSKIVPSSEYFRRELGRVRSPSSDRSQNGAVKPRRGRPPGKKNQTSGGLSDRRCSTRRLSWRRCSSQGR